MLEIRLVYPTKSIWGDPPLANVVLMPSEHPYQRRSLLRSKSYNMKRPTC